MNLTKLLKSLYRNEPSIFQRIPKKKEYCEMFLKRKNMFPEAQVNHTNNILLTRNGHPSLTSLMYNTPKCFSTKLKTADKQNYNVANLPPTIANKKK